ncbi:MAG: S46 family peptidase, partial [Bacteroidota bacterium]
MKRITIILTLFANLVFCGQMKADEGEWLPSLIGSMNINDMQRMGMKLSADEIYSVNHGSVKDAIVHFGAGCSGSMVSPEGLLLTAHHCGLDYIQSNSSAAADFVKNGFFATNRDEELPNPGLSVSFLIRIEDVTDKIKKVIDPNMTESIRREKIREISIKLEAEATSKTTYNASVKSVFDDTEFYLFVYETYKDVRLVGAPPFSIGNFGGDTDNWMWPRHTGDFSFFRVYMSPDGKPAEYAKNNIPFKPKHFLPISLNGVHENDFVFTMGYPGKTERYLTSYGVQLATDQTNPSIVKIRDKKLNILDASMNESDPIRLKYISKYQNTSNYWKFFIGQTKQIKQLNVYNQKKQFEDAFQKWMNTDGKKKEKYGNILTDIAKYYEEKKKYNLYDVYFREIIRRGTDITTIAFKFYDLYLSLYTLSSKKETNINNNLSTLKDVVREHVKTFDLATDKKVFIALLKMFSDDIPSDIHPEIFNSIKKDFEGNFENYANDLYSKTMFADPAKLWNFMNNPNLKDLENDLCFKMMLSFLRQNEKLQSQMIEANWKFSSACRLYIEGIREMNPEKKLYPDANSTMRIAYGKVNGYSAVDGLKADYFTTINGVMQKEDNSNREFIVPDKLNNLFRYKD